MLDNEIEIFKELNNELQNHGIKLEVICVGGFVLSHYGLKQTMDIDGFYERTTEIDDIIARVGDKFEINTDEELWLNNSVQSMNKIPDKDICTVLYDFWNLTVYMPPLEYIAGMKLQSGREKDIEDVALIIKKENLGDPIELIKLLKDRYDFDGIDISMVLTAYGKAYGFKWLENYYQEHESELITIM